MRTDFHITPGEESWSKLMSFIAQLGDGEYTVTVSNQKTRTPKQQAAIEVYCRTLAEKMADAGIDFREAVHFPITPTQALVKDCIWRRVQLALYPDKPSTTQLETPDVSEVYERVNSATAEMFGISMPFPSLDNQAFEALTDRSIDEGTA